VAQLQGASDVYETNGLAEGRTLVSKDFKESPVKGGAGGGAALRPNDVGSPRFSRRGTLGGACHPPSRTVKLRGIERDANSSLQGRGLEPQSKTTRKEFLQAKWTWVCEVPFEVMHPGSPMPDKDEDEHTDGGGPVYSVNAVGFVNGSAALSSFLPGGNASDDNKHCQSCGWLRRGSIARADDGPGFRSRQGPGCAAKKSHEKFLLALMILSVGAGAYLKSDANLQPRLQQEADTLRQAWIVERQWLATAQIEQTSLAEHEDEMKRTLALTRPTPLNELLAGSANQSRRSSPD